MSDIIKIGTQDATFKVGSSAVTAAYLGSTQVYPQGEPPTPVGFKYKLTLSDSSVVSAECDGTSAITQDEISAYTSSTVAVEIGECVTSIGTNAFRNFSGITNVELPDSVVSISDGAFRSCTNLASISLPSSLTSIGGGTFRSCTNLESVVIPDSVSGISYDVFSDCVSLTSVTIPSSVTSIGYTAFKRCSGLTSVDIPSGVTRIAFEAFSYCTNLESITVEAVVPPTLEQNVFYGSTCPIYVPCESVEAYKSASVWSSYSSRITCIPTPTYKWVSYESGDTVPTATTVYGVRIYPLYDSNYNVTFSGSNGDYIKLYPDGFSDWSAVDENGSPIDISSYRIRPGYAEYEIPFSDLGMGGMNIISPTTIFEDDIDLYVTN